MNQIQNAIRPNARKVFCVKFQREMEGLDEIPFEGHPLGQKIYDNISKEAWKMWIEVESFSSTLYLSPLLPATEIFHYHASSKSR